jgi:hypothetical protein
MTIRRIILALTAALGVFVGAWAAFWPTSFYDSFPGLGRIWVAIPHLAYHLAHLESLAPIDVIGNVMSLGGSLALGSH